MKDDNKTKKQLMHELTELRSQNVALKKTITGSISAELAAEKAHSYAESIVGTLHTHKKKKNKVYKKNWDYYFIMNCTD